MGIIAEERRSHQDTFAFDLLPDEILLDIFNKLHDAKSLTRCLVVCRRFSSLAPQVNSLFLAVPRREINSSYSKRSYVGLIFRKFMKKQLKYFRRFIGPKRSADRGSSAISCPALNRFREIKSMNVEFPVCRNGIGSLVGGGDDCLIKWKAEFGRDLKTCIILGAPWFHKRNPPLEDRFQVEDNEQILSDEQLKLRIVWTISCLISSSARHHLLKQFVSDHPNLQSVVASDCENQGKLSMDGEQLFEMRQSMDSSSQRTPLPDLGIKMFYSPVLELPASGCTMTGATLIVIRAIGDDRDGVVMKDGSDVGDLMRGWFDAGEGGENEAFGEAVREMMKVKKSYLMTINSF